MEVNIMNGKEKGFTLVEILIAIVIISIIATSVRPVYTEIVKKSRESALKKNLYVIRDAIDKFSVDNADEKGQPKFPETLEILVESRYLRFIPEDPFTGKEEWNEVAYSEDATGIFDIRSFSEEVGSNGKKYSEW